jgi:hypothetical protein
VISRHQVGMKNSQNTIRILGTAFIIATGGFIFSGCRSSDNTLKPFEALGTVAAQQAARLAGGPGQILLIVPDMGGAQIPAWDAEMKAFQKELSKNNGVTIAATRNVSLEQPKAPPKTQNLRFFEPAPKANTPPPPGQLGELINDFAQAKVVVYFVDLPPIAGPDLAILKQKGVKLMAVSSLRPNYKALLKGGTLHAAIVPRWDPAPNAAKKPKTAQDWFDQTYKLVTPEDADSLP